MRVARHYSRQRGIALILVLWLLVLLSVIAASYARMIRTETRLAYNQVQAGKAYSLAEAGAQHAILELLVRDDAQRWPGDGTIHRLAFGEGFVDIAIRDARGLVDINRASPLLLDRVLAAAGVEERKRSAMVDAILDWRDADSLKHLHGAEDEDYRRAGVTWTAGDAPFSSIEELRYVLGMSDTLFRRLAPYLTVQSTQGGVISALAPPWLVSALGNEPNPTTPAAAGAQGRGTAFHITVQATLSEGATASVDLVVRINGAGKQPYSILSWRSPALAAASAATATGDVSTPG